MLSDNYYTQINEAIVESLDGKGLCNILDSIKDRWINSGNLLDNFLIPRIGNAAISIFTFSDRSCFLIICETKDMIAKSLSVNLKDEAIVGMISLLPPTAITSDNFEEFVSSLFKLDTVKDTLNQIESKAILLNMFSDFNKPN